MTEQEKPKRARLKLVALSLLLVALVAAVILLWPVLFPSYAGDPIVGRWENPSGSVSFQFRASGHSAVCVPFPAGDLDSDGDVDLDDWWAVRECMSGPDVPEPDCEDADLDGDGDVDLADVAAFQNEFGEGL